jgi:eukaryotic-like serine/threonine-protein kinase
LSDTVLPFRSAPEPAKRKASLADTAFSQTDGMITPGQARPFPEHAPGELDTAPPDFPRIEGFEIERELGKGGMGVVYQARETALHRTVAIKMIRNGPSADEADIARFEREAEAVAQLQHPNIVQIYRIGRHDGMPFFVMEYCPRGSLAARINGAHPPTRQAAALVETLARAVAYAHAYNVVHRDLKPENILISDIGPRNADAGSTLASAEPTSAERQKSEILKITDFGLARRLDAETDLDACSFPIGTPSFMAPEQARGDNRLIGPLSDVWALGVILFRLVTGRFPFSGATNTRILHNVKVEDPQLPIPFEPQVDRDLAAICLKCLQKDPALRYLGAQALADDLRRWLNGEPILARPTGRVERCVKWVRRNTALTTGIAAALVAVAVLFLWQRAERRWETDQRDLETRQRNERLQLLVEHSEESVRDQIKNGRFREALAMLDDIILPRLKLEPELHGQIGALEALRNQAFHLAEFFDLADRAWFKAGDDDRSGLRALHDCRAALRHLGIISSDEGRFDHLEWWQHLPDDLLSDKQQNRLRAEIYGQIVLMALLHMREGMMLQSLDRGLINLLTAKNPGTSEHYRVSLQLIEQARGWELWKNTSPSRTVQLMQRVSSSLLALDRNPVGDAVTHDGDGLHVPAEETTDEIVSAEYFHDGLLHFYVGRFPDNWVVRLITRLFVRHLESATALKRAEEDLRAATRLVPGRFLPHYILGWTLMARNDYAGAELAFNTCISLKPNEPRCYIWRGAALVNQAVQINDAESPLRQDLIKRAMADRDRAMQLDANLLENHWKSAEIFVALGKTRQAIDSYRSALELEGGLLLQWAPRHNHLTEVNDWIRKFLRDNPFDADAQALNALIRLRFDDLKGARSAAEKCLQRQPNHHRALAVRGMALLKKGNSSEALSDFVAALKVSPENYLARLGKAWALERQQRLDQSLAEFESLLARPEQGSIVLRTDWQRIEVLLGKARVLDLLGRGDDARSTREEAQAIDRDAADYLARHSQL